MVFEFHHRLCWNCALQGEVVESNLVRVVIVDDHPIVRAGIHQVLDSVPDIRIVGEARNGQDAIQQAADLRPDVLVLDLNLPDLDGLEVIRRLRRQNLPTAVLILTIHSDPQMVFGLLQAGVSGYVLKEDALETLATAILAVAHGEVWLSSRIAANVVQRAIGFENPAPRLVSELTARELEILQLLAQGLDNQAIAMRLTLALRTVQNHVSNIYGKLGVTARTEAMLYAIRHGIISVSQKTEG